MNHITRKKFKISLALHIPLLFILFLFSNVMSAQMEGKIHFTETFKLDIQIEGMNESMMDMIPNSQSIDKELLFTAETSLYQNKKGESIEDTELESDDGSFKIMIVHDDTEELLYCAHKAKQKIHQRGIMGKSFIVESPMVKNKWKITQEKIKYLGYECTKAVIETDEVFVVAWFTSELPLQIGPADYYGLPGAVLMVNVDDGDIEIKATKIDLEKLQEEIKIPNDGKKVSEEKFEEIKIAKEKELTESMENMSRH